MFNLKIFHDDHPNQSLNDRLRTAEADSRCRENRIGCLRSFWSVRFRHLSPQSAPDYPLGAFGFLPFPAFSDPPNLVHSAASFTVFQSVRS